MRLAHFVTKIGDMDEDEMWGVFTDWEGLLALFKDPQGWIAHRNALIANDDSQPQLPPVAAGSITFVVTYQLETTLKDDAAAAAPGHPALSCDENGLNVLPIFVLSGRGAGVIQVRILKDPVLGFFPEDLAAYVAAGGATLHTPAGSQPIPGGSVIEFPDGATLTVPGKTPPRLTLQPDAGIAYLHFPISGSVASEFFVGVVRDPQGFVEAVRRYLNAGLVQIVGNPTNDTKIQISDLVPAQKELLPLVLSQYRLVYQSYIDTPSTDLCGKITAQLTPTPQTLDSYDVAIDTVLGYTY